MQMVSGQRGPEHHFEEDELADIWWGVNYNAVGYSARELSEQYGVSASVIRRVIRQIFSGEIGPYANK